MEHFVEARLEEEDAACLCGKQEGCWFAAQRDGPAGRLGEHEWSQDPQSTSSARRRGLVNIVKLHLEVPARVVRARTGFAFELELADWVSTDCSGVEPQAAASGCGMELLAGPAGVAGDQVVESLRRQAAEEGHWAFVEAALEAP